MKNVSHKSCREMLKNIPPPKKNQAVYTIMWKNEAEWGRPQMTI
jgi:hypothetical protein